MKLAIATLFATISSGHAFLAPATTTTTTTSRSTALSMSSPDRRSFLTQSTATAAAPTLALGNRIGSGSYGTVHEGYLLHSKEDIVPCVAKRYWSRDEIEINIPQRVCGEKRGVRTGLAYAKKEEERLSSEEVESRAERCRHYWEVERHCFQKLEDRKEDGDEIRGKATPAFLGVFGDDGSGSESLGEMEGYGLISTKKGGGGWFNNGNEKEEDCHKWMVFEIVKSVEEEGCALTLLDAMEVSITSLYHVMLLRTNNYYTSFNALHCTLDGLERQTHQ
jgi:hypothetical protein